LFGVRLLDHREVWHIGRSVGKWTWKHITAQGFSAWQAKAAGRSAKVRRDASEDKRASARLMAAAGRTQREIAAELDVNQSTVARWLA
jgi:DNA invertase Pin-like site-specific DNA recombinase